MDAIDVARLMHRLFSAFDAAVTGAGLFKMDTVGDAYVAAGFLQQAQYSSFKWDENAAALEAGQACDRVLLAARDMRLQRWLRAGRRRGATCTVGSGCQLGRC